jgi:hypothetical protein
MPNTGGDFETTHLHHMALTLFRFCWRGYFVSPYLAKQERGGGKGTEGYERYHQRNTVMNIESRNASGSYGRHPGIFAWKTSSN